MTVEIPDALLCLFNTRVKRRDGRYVIEIPEHEIEQGALVEQGVYRIGLFSTDRTAAADQQTEQPSSGPPVEEGDLREVEIEDVGDQGDGIARVERGFVVIVPATEIGERVTIEITDVRKNVAFAEVRDRQTHV